ncbi:MAG: dTDP-4-dehydrorhamnose reductase [Bacteroidota bacterium]
MEEPLMLVTGCTGQLGQEWMNSVYRHQCVGVGHKKMDLTDPSSIADTLDKHQPDIVINTAAYTQVDQAEDEPEIAKAVNADGVKQLARACRDRGIFLVHYSTDYVFPGKTEDKQRYPKGYPEDAPVDPINVYGESKLKGEQYIRELMNDFLIIRVSWLCGQYGSNFIRTMLKLGQKREELSVVNDQWGSPTFTHHTVVQTIGLLETGSTGIFHCTSNGLITWYELAEYTLRKAGIDVEIKPVTSDEFPTKAPRPAFSKLDPQKMLKRVKDGELPWRMGVDQLLQAYLDSSIL